MPVMRGMLAGSFSAKGRGRRTGHFCISCTFVAVLELGDDLVDRVRAGLDVLDLGRRRVRVDHDLLDDGLRLLDGADDDAAVDGVADLERGLEVPLLGVVEAGREDTAEDEVAHLVLEDLQGALDAVVDGGEEAGAELDGEGGAGLDDGLAGLDARGLFVDLDDGLVARDLDDLAHELLVAHEDDVVHAGLDARGGHDGAGDTVDLPPDLPDAGFCCWETWAIWGTPVGREKMGPFKSVSAPWHEPRESPPATPFISIEHP